mmetsp:Transcript_50206/g.144396  ORF Transcript_50206/g.144396 Transcript_50206/m.144396 type:complete len:238 (+) Transcript_50206:137-850(+)
MGVEQSLPQCCLEPGMMELHVECTQAGSNVGYGTDDGDSDRESLPDPIKGAMMHDSHRHWQEALARAQMAIDRGQEQQAAQAQRLHVLLSKAPQYPLTTLHPLNTLPPHLLPPSGVAAFPPQCHPWPQQSEVLMQQVHQDRSLSRQQAPFPKPAALQPVPGQWQPPQQLLRQLEEPRSPAFCPGLPSGGVTPRHPPRLSPASAPVRDPPPSTPTVENRMPQDYPTKFVTLPMVMFDD